jgi:hypothetical protein
MCNADFKKYIDNNQILLIEYTQQFSYHLFFVNQLCTVFITCCNVSC